MGQDPQGLPEPLTGTLAELPTWAGQLLDVVVTRDDPQLARRLRATRDPSPDDHQSVADIMTREFSTQVHGPDWAPTSYGRDVDNALGEFFLRFPTDRT